MGRELIKVARISAENICYLLQYIVRIKINLTISHKQARVRRYFAEMIIVCCAISVITACRCSKERVFCTSCG